MRQTARKTLQSLSPPRIFYGWQLVGVTVLTMAVVITPIFQGLGTFFVALERHFGWSRTMLSGAFSLSRAEGAVLGPLEGFLTDRLGSRRMILIGFVVLGAGFVALSFIQSIVGFYITFLIVFAGAGLGGFIPLMTAINRWFFRRRAMAMAIGQTGMNLGGLLVPALAWAVVSLGWRATTFGMGLAILALSVPISRMVRNRPEEYGLHPDGDSPSTPSEGDASDDGTPEDDEVNFSVGEAIRTSGFWAITAAHGFSAIAAVTVGVHIIPALTDLGMSLQMAGTVVATYTFTGMVFQLVAGWIGDRFPKPPVIAAFVAIQGIGMLVAAILRTVPGAFLFAILYGVGFGGRVPLLTAIRGDYFGTRNFATILGVSQLPMNIAMMGAPIAAGYLFDTLGSYAVPFLGLGLLNFVGALSILLAKKPALPSSRQQQASLAEEGTG